jgi:hypothetical protein
MASTAEPVVREAGRDDVVAICRFGDAYIRPHYAPLIGAAAADEQVRRWWNGTHDHVVYKLYIPTGNPAHGVVWRARSLAPNTGRDPTPGR